MLVKLFVPIQLDVVLANLLNQQLLVNLSFLIMSVMSIMSTVLVLLKHQFGFQKGKSTEHAILDIYASILKALEKKQKACCIFLDFAKAFDTVNHEILLTKLEYYGVRGIAHELMKSYLSERLQCVKIRQKVSDFKRISYLWDVYWGPFCHVFDID